MAEATERCPELKKFDHRLCAYAVSVVQTNRSTREFNEEIAPALRGSLHALICNDDYSEALLTAPLTEDELYELTRAFELPPTGTKWLWEPYEPLYRLHWDTVTEVRRLAPPRMLQDWTDACGRYSDLLKADDLPLAEGLESMHAWVRLLRKLIRACSEEPLENAAPVTEPAFDPQAKYETLPERIKKAIDEIRGAIGGKPDWKPGDPAEDKPLGDQATSRQLANRLSLSTRTLSDALFWMHVHGQYQPDGYKPTRMKGGPTHVWRTRS